MSFFLIGATGFEPATSASRTQRSTKLSHAPILLICAVWNLCLKSQDTKITAFATTMIIPYLRGGCQA